MPFEVPQRISGAVPDSGRLDRIRKTLAASVKPVRPLPSNAVMMMMCVGAFAGLAILLAFPAGFSGFAKMSASGRWMDYSALLLIALVMAGSVVEQMIPGSRRTMRPVWLIVIAMLLLSVASLVLFPDSGLDAHPFVSRGIPCLRYGVLCAIPGGALTWILMRCGFVTDPVSGAISAGAFSGLLGTAALALHCPILNAAHIIAWHVGVIVVTSLAGVVIGFVQVRR